MSASSVAGNGDEHAESACLVCGADASGIHCGVNSCRACAAFFRRSLERGHKYKCQRVSYNCTISKSGRDSCKHCRFQKCKLVGMSMACRRRIIKHEELLDPQPSVSAMNLDTPAESLPEVTVQDYNFHLDTEGPMRRVIEILMTPPAGAHFFAESPLQSLERAFRNMVPGGKPKDVRVTRTVNYRVYVHNLHEQMERIAKWAMACQQFALLPLEDKRKMYCNSWHAIYAIERCARTMEFMDPDTPPQILMLSDTTAYDLHEYEYDMPEVDPEKLKSIVEHFKPFNRLAVENVIIPMREMNVTSVEVVYLCLYKVWSVRKVRDLSPSTYAIASKVLDEAGNELHNHYVNELRNANYASRLAQLCKLVDGLEFIYCRFSEIRLTADMCKVYKSNFDESEFRNYARNMS